MANGPTTKWIIGLCLTALVAVVGWTVTGTLAMRMKTFDEVKSDVSSVQSNVSANNIRISVLENKWDNIQGSLAEIKVLLTTHMRDTR